ncbi:hypothetical protein GLOIN_2v1884984 [Rhizophagus clarus]|uniref:C2H2-type domain-containing protein n=1 Tax=Rhizophagus clarus TaxID=94130 RepID=A0A8H3QR67_9GLOM|nr:hypothetical protein GLOIN_2v1884984 [Rhizophagus clarus]
MRSFTENHTKQFWNAFQDALDSNIRGIDGKRRILSIIADTFSYETIKQNLSVISNYSITKASYYAHINGPGGVQMEKPKIVHQRIPLEKKDQIESFFQNKSNVIMSSYKTDSASGLPVYYLKNTKKILWERFHKEYPDGLKRIAFYGYLQGNQYIYKEDLGGLCSICNTYRYESFDELQKLIQCHILNLNLQGEILNKCNNLQRYLKKDYENELKIDLSDYTQHDACINHCMLYAFGTCSQLHTKICNHCESFFHLFKQVQEHIPSDSHTELEELQGKWTFLEAGLDIELAIEGIREISVAYLKPKRTKALGKKRINTLPGNSNWFSWEWPNEGEYAGYICARSMPNIGKWNYFSPEKLEKLQKKKI